MCGSTMIGGLALGAQTAGAIGQTYASYRKSEGEKQGYEYQSQVARNNAQLSEWQAQDALTRGVNTRQQIQLKGAQIEGTQRAVIASRNVALNEGSALNLLTDTQFGTARDANIATDNANKEAWALRNQAAFDTSNSGFLKARADSTSPMLDAAGTALTTAGRVASSWYTMRTRSNAGSMFASVWGD